MSPKGDLDLAFLMARILSFFERSSSSTDGVESNDSFNNNNSSPASRSEHDLHQCFYMYDIYSIYYDDIPSTDYDEERREIDAANSSNPNLIIYFDNLEEDEYETESDLEDWNEEEEDDSEISELNNEFEELEIYSSTIYNCFGPNKKTFNGFERSQ
ncbi:unnamed protein product [Lepeophtheirus salmonis]|uniref:(salmon louse) hypothetical protein n=1 Tax=Lepeophtheirus salmonis TaxID=72036 RepID=A0A0K2U3H0_LEPSM|nr:unnamed protein product [Lepeophtheirus salmonis]CAF2822660.1 unnamed protein product [Lepeophtheirus salmonis]